MEAQLTKKIPAWYIPAWSSRSISVATTIIILNQITYYSTEVLGLNVAVVGIVFLVAKLFDAVVDFFIGHFIDNHSFKKGKARPYELLIVPLWILIVMLFSTPNFGEIGKLIYIFIIYVLITSICQSTLQATETIYLGRAVEGEQDRGKLLAVSGVLVMFVSAIASMLLPNLMVQFGNQANGWTKISLIYAIPMALLGMVRYFFIKEVKVNKESQVVEKINLRENIQILLKNKYIFILCIIFLFATLIQNIMSIVGTYYFTYVIGNLGLLGLVGLLGLISPIVLLLFPIALRKIGSVNFLKIGLIISAAASIVRFFFPNSIAVVLLTVMLTGIGATLINMLNSYFVLQCIDFGELKFGQRLEGLAAALNSFMVNLGQGISSAFVGIVMAIGGYVQANPVQTESALLSIRSLYSLIPAILAIAIIISLQFFDVEKQIELLRANKD